MTLERAISGDFEFGVMGSRAAQDLLGPIRVNDLHEVGNNGLNGVGSEIILIKLLVISMAVDVRNSRVGYDSGSHDADRNNQIMVRIRTVNSLAPLLELEFALGDIDDGDGDRTGIGDFNASDVVGPNNLEL